MKHKFIPTQLSFLTRTMATIITLLVLVSLAVSTVFAIDTGFSSPSVASTTGKGWKNVSYAFTSDDLYATAIRSNKVLKLSKFNISSIPGGSTINGIEVYVEGWTTGLQAKVELSYNGGKAWTDPLYTALASTEDVNLLGGSTNTWGRTWNASEFTNTNFMVKLTTTGTTTAGNGISVDQVRVGVYYTPPNTTITLPAVSGSYSGTVDLSATLTVTADGTPLPLKKIDFYLGGDGVDSSGNCTGTYIDSATTQPDTGEALLSDAQLPATLSAGFYPYGTCASFAGDGIYQATSMTSPLEIVGTASTLVVAPVTGTYGDNVTLSATLTTTDSGLPVNGVFITFTLFGNELGASKTNPSGIATLNASLAGYDVGTSESISARFDGNANHSPATATGQITINKRPITVTAVPDTKVYDGTTDSIGVPVITSGSLVTDDIASFIQAFDNKDADTGKTLTPSGVVDDGNSGLNYAYTFEAVTTGTINPALLTVTADDQEKLITQPDPEFTYVASGFIGSEGFITPPTCGVPVPHDVTDTYDIVCSGGDAGTNYTINYINGTLTVEDNPVVLSITRANPSPTTASSVNFTVTFSEPVTGVDTSAPFYDFTLATTGVPNGAAITAVVDTGAHTTYIVTVNTGIGNGTIRLDVVDDNSILDMSSKPLGGDELGDGNFTSGEVYTVYELLMKTIRSIGSQDGWILESLENSNMGGKPNSAATTFYLGDDAQDKQYRSILSFATKGLPDNAVITNVTLKLRKQGIVGGGNPVNIFRGFIVDVKKGFFGTAPGLQVGDFQAKGNRSYGLFKPAPSGGWYTINLTPAKANINKLATKGGVTQIRLRFKLDDNDNAIANYLKLYSGNAPLASRPQLIIQYYVP